MLRPWLVLLCISPACLVSLSGRSRKLVEYNATLAQRFGENPSLSRRISSGRSISRLPRNAYATYPMRTSDGSKSRGRRQACLLVSGLGNRAAMEDTVKAGHFYALAPFVRHNRARAEELGGENATVGGEANHDARHQAAAPHSQAEDLV